MKTLFALELKKLTKKRMNIIVITVCLILAGILFYLPVGQFIVLDTDGKQTSGMEAIAMDKEFSNSNAGKLTNEKIKADIAKYQALFDDPENVSKDATQKSLNDSAYFKYLPVQVLNTIAPYNLSLLGATLLAIATLYLVMIGMVAITLLLSAKMKSSVPVLSIIILAMILPMFLGISETTQRNSP